MDWHRGYSSIRMPKKNVAASSLYNLKPRFFSRRHISSLPGGDSYGDLYSNEFERRAALIILQAELNDLSHPFHEGVQILCLGVTAPKGRDGGNVAVIFVPFDDDRELPMTFHVPTLSRHVSQAVKDRTKSPFDPRGCGIGLCTQSRFR